MATCSYTVPDKNTTGDNFYGTVICNQAYIDYFWNTYGFSGNKDYWDDGFGWEDPCNTDKPLARTFNACYLLTYSAQDVPGRAETLIHESRHQGGKPHNAKFPAGSVFGAGKDGADSDWNYQGAWMYGALYLWWFYAQGARTTSALRERARQRGNLVIDNAFATHPGFNI